MSKTERNFNSKIESFYLKIAISKDSLLRALRVAVLVGIILNVINNPVLLNFSLEGMNFYRVLLTFIVPFCVSLYSSILSDRKCIEATVK